MGDNGIRAELREIDGVKYKKCNPCNTWKPIDQFNKNKRSYNGYGSTCKSCNKEYKKEHYIKNKEKISDKNKTYRENNKEKIKKEKRKYYQDNKDKINKKINDKYHNDLNFRRVHNVRIANNKNLKRAMKFYEEGRIDELPEKSPSKKILKILQDQNNICAYCFNDMSENYHLDHITPLSKNGSNKVRNLIFCCSNCNLRKNNDDLEIWLEKCGINYEEFVDMVIKRNKRLFDIG